MTQLQTRALDRSSILMSVYCSIAPQTPGCAVAHFTAQRAALFGVPSLLPTSRGFFKTFLRFCARRKNTEIVRQPAWLLALACGQLPVLFGQPPGLFGQFSGSVGHPPVVVHRTDRHSPFGQIPVSQCPPSTRTLTDRCPDGMIVGPQMSKSE